MGEGWLSNVKLEFADLAGLRVKVLRFVLIVWRFNSRASPNLELVRWWLDWERRLIESTIVDTAEDRIGQLGTADVCALEDTVQGLGRGT